MSRVIKTISIGMGVFSILVGAAVANPSDISIFDKELHKVKYNYAYYASMRGEGAWEFDEPVSSNDEITEKRGHKSPAKAFFLSLAVPGLGQYYYGSKVKSAAFIGVEAATWIFHISWHNKGEKLTDEFEQFNRDHWIQDHYEDYLEDAYGFRDDDSISAPEASHNLPDTLTQQYYEMTGKYDQFAWGWDDAILNGLKHADFDTSASLTFTPAIGPTIPKSDHRLSYEIMRDNANKKLDNADKMLMVALANRVIAAVEAFISTKSINNTVKKAGEFSNWKIKPTLKSYNHRRDTPYLKVTYKF